jgi:hypothetical protein
MVAMFLNRKPGDLTQQCLWNDMKIHIYVIADVLADGIVKQLGSKKREGR